MRLLFKDYKKLKETQVSLRLLREVSGHSDRFFDSKSGNPVTNLICKYIKTVFLSSFLNFQGLSPLPYRIDEDELNDLEAQEEENNNKVSICRNLF